MTKKQAIEESIKHYKRMIKWAKKQPQNDIALLMDMDTKLGETYGADDCPMCVKYRIYPRCNVCPLGAKYNDGFSCTPSWRAVFHSKTWGEWVIHAEVLLKDLKGLIKPSKKKNI